VLLHVQHQHDGCVPVAAAIATLATSAPVAVSARAFAAETAAALPAETSGSSAVAAAT